MKILEFLTNLIAHGECSFTFAQVKEKLRVSDIAIRAALHRLKQKGAIAQPAKGFYVIVPPEYRILGCRPAEHFISELIEHLGAAAYVGLLTAAQYYGAAHHRPQQYQVITTQKRRSILCGKIKIVFITKKTLENVPLQKINTSHSIITASSPEATAMDLVIYAKRCGGLDNTLTVLAELVNKVDAKMLIKLASETKEIAWVQRLGYLLDLINAKKISGELEKIIKKRGAHTRTLMSIRKLNPLYKVNQNKLKKQVTKNKKWKLIINKNLEPDI